MRQKPLFSLYLNLGARLWSEIRNRTSLWRRPFFVFVFGLHLNLGTKFRTEIQLLSLTKLHKNSLLPRNLHRQQKINTYACHGICVLLSMFAIIVFVKNKMNEGCLDVKNFVDFWISFDCY